MPEFYCDCDCQGCEDHIPKGTPVKAKLQYFKESGKFYADGELEIDPTLEMFQIFALFNQMKIQKMLPGLMEGHSNFTTYITVPGHKNNYPAILR